VPAVRHRTHLSEVGSRQARSSRLTYPARTLETGLCRGRTDSSATPRSLCQHAGGARQADGRRPCASAHPPDCHRGGACVRPDRPGGSAPRVRGGVARGVASTTCDATWMSANDRAVRQARASRGDPHGLDSAARWPGALRSRCVRPVVGARGASVARLASTPRASRPHVSSRSIRGRVTALPRGRPRDRASDSGRNTSPRVS
jgi:hypothetical protein